MDGAYKFGLEFNFGRILENSPILDFASGLAIRMWRCGKDVEKLEKGGKSLGVEMWRSGRGILRFLLGEKNKVF